MVVMSHLFLSLKEKVPSNKFVAALGCCCIDYIELFFMPAFFVITGLCSNFGKRFKDYLVSNLISLKAPVFFFVALPGALGGLIPMYGFPPLSLKWWLIRMFDTGVWFLHALFLAKIAYWFIHRTGRIWEWALVLSLYLFGMAAFMMRLPEFGWCYHACALMVFLQFGTCLRNFNFTKHQTIISSVLFFTTAALIQMGGGRITLHHSESPMLPLV